MPRAREQLADNPEQWAVEPFGPPPVDPDPLTAWTERVGTVAAHRELTCPDDPSTALGPAPKAGQVESYASWRSAWRALGRPESGSDELEMSDGQLLMRVRAHEREAAWEPKYVGDELARTRQTVSARRQEATMRRAEAAAAYDAERDRLTREATEADALAMSCTSGRSSSPRPTRPALCGSPIPRGPAPPPIAPSRAVPVSLHGRAR
jgi:hypothetical protein